MIQFVNLPNAEDTTDNLFVSGDRGSFEQLYDHYSPSMFAVICRIIGNTELAGDVLLQAFVQIWDGSLSYNVSSKKVSVWMIKHARMCALHTLKQQNGIENDSELKSFISNKNTLDKFSEVSVLAASIHQDHVFEHMFIYNKTTRQVCTLLNTTEEKVTLQLKAAINRLKSIPTA